VLISTTYHVMQTKALGPIPTSSNEWLHRCWRRGCRLYRVVDTFASRRRCVIGPTCQLWASYTQALLNWHDFYSLDKPDRIAEWLARRSHVHQVPSSNPDQRSQYFLPSRIDVNITRSDIFAHNSTLFIRKTSHSDPCRHPKVLGRGPAWEYWVQ